MLDLKNTDVSPREALISCGKVAILRMKEDTETNMADTLQNFYLTTDIRSYYRFLYDY